MLPTARTARLPAHATAALDMMCQHKRRAWTQGERVSSGCGVRCFGGVVTENHGDSPFWCQALHAAFKLLKPLFNAALKLVADGAKGMDALRHGPFGLGRVVKRPIERLEGKRIQARTVVLRLVAVR